MKSLRSLIFLYPILLLSGALWIAGCGGSNVKNPAQESEEEITTSPKLEESLDVNINVSEDTVQPGQTVQLTATVEPVQGSRVMLDWINVTKHGKLSTVNQNSATWVAPKTLDTVDVRVEVVHLVVTAVIQVVSVKESGIDTGTKILTDTKTVLLTVTGNTGLLSE